MSHSNFIILFFALAAIFAGSAAVVYAYQGRDGMTVLAALTFFACAVRARMEVP